MMDPGTPQDIAASRGNDDKRIAGTAIEEQVRRAAIYSLLAALLRDTPDQTVRDYVEQWTDEPSAGTTELTLAFGSLALASRHSRSTALREEFHALFIGLGRGELVPYGSWYMTGFLMERPLSVLRADLARLGFERDPNVHEPEDHIAALCEVMALLIQDGTPINVQKHFFETHLGSWADRFFDDLGTAESAVFYRSVARLGSAFIAIETRYLSLLD